MGALVHGIGGMLLLILLLLPPGPPAVCIRVSLSPHPCIHDPLKGGELAVKQQAERSAGHT